MKLCSIASGSSGNCTFVSSDKTKLMIDAGLSGKKIETGLETIGVNPEELKALFITHEHIDHVQGVGVLARRYNLPVYGTAETICSMLKIKSVGRIPEHLLNYVKADEGFYVDDIYVEPFAISHDSSNPVCYTFTSEGRKVAMATDLGKYDDYIISKLKGAEAILLEANHDVNMLMVGGYPYYLKQRILGDRGHLSNEHSASLIRELMNEKVQHITLAHLSDENNYEELAYETVRQELLLHTDENRVNKMLSVAKKHMASPMLELV